MKPGVDIEIEEWETEEKPVRDHAAEYQQRLNANPNKELTGMQEMFCQHYTSNGFKVQEAALAAGYGGGTNPSVAHAKGSELKNLPHIQRRIEELMKPFKDRLAIDRESAYQEIAKIAYEDKDAKTRIAAWKVIGDWKGWNSDKRTVSLTSNLDNMEPDELLKFIESLEKAKQE